ncbi:hypothetical protein Tco_0686175 [Tanacetum coccineum]
MRYIAPPTNLILDKHLNEFDMTRVDENGNFKEDMKELSIKTHVECDTFIQKLLNKVDAHGVVLGLYMAIGKNFKSELVGYHANDDGFFFVMDVAHGSGLKAWLRACCLFVIPSKSRGVFRSNSTLTFEFLFP